MSIDAILDKAQRTRWTPGRIIVLALTVILILIAVANITRLAGRNGSGIYLVKQAYWSGNLSCKFSPGIYGKWLALVEPYNMGSSYKYSDKESDKKTAVAPPIEVRFNDGGKAKVYGDVRFVLPANEQDMARIHTIFGSQEGLMQECYSQITKEAVVMTAALMSSEESYASRRSQFSDWVSDQIQNGIYLTEGQWVQEGTDDDGNPNMRFVVEIARNPETGQPLRKETVVSGFNIRVAQCVINDIEYLEGLDDLIGQKREFLTSIIAANSAAEKAEQDMLTAEATGKKDVEVARYAAKQAAEKKTAEVKNQKKQALIAAEKRLAVAEDNYYAALDQKETWILKGKGEAEKRRLAMEADGAIVTKQHYYKEAWEAYRDALVKQRLVPDVTTSYEAGDMPAGIVVLNAIDQQLQRELGIDLTFDAGGGSN